MNKFAVIMAGGKGERFWPESRENRPKQMLSLFSSRTLIEQTVLRLHEFVPYENMLIITNRAYAEPLRRLLPQLAPENIIGEPARRDTAPCIALAAGIIQARDPDGLMTVFPADHVITAAAKCTADLNLACANAADSLVTIGVAPTFPSSDYGYIEAETKEKVSSVRRFVEKPPRETAERFIAAGNFLWNAGIFVWRLGTLKKAFREFIPSLADFMDRTAENRGKASWEQFLASRFPEQQKISIDYAVMEKSSCIKVVRAGFDWDDVGNWNSLRNHLVPDGHNNISVGNVRLLNCADNIIFSRDQEHLVAGIDLNGMVVVHTGDVTLVCRNSSTVRLKELLKEIGAEEELKKYL